MTLLGSTQWTKLIKTRPKNIVHAIEEIFYCNTFILETDYKAVVSKHNLNLELEKNKNLRSFSCSYLMKTNELKKDLDHLIFISIKI